jgi:hypothetical protein
MNAKRESPMKEAVGATVVVPAVTVVPAAPGYRVVRVQFADTTSPALTTVTPVVAWRVWASGDVEPVVLPVEGMDPQSPECGIEGADWPGVISHGQRYHTLLLFAESRRDALRAALAARAQAAGVGVTS